MTKNLIAFIAIFMTGLAIAEEPKTSLKSWDKPPEMKLDVNKTYRATIDTSKGKIVIELFGEVKEGQDVVKAIAAAPRDAGDRPNEQITMKSVTIEEK